MGRDKDIELQEHVAVPAELEVGIDSPLEGKYPPVFDPGDLHPGPGLQGEILDRLALEEGERAAKNLGRTLRWFVRGFGYECIETADLMRTIGSALALLTTSAMIGSLAFGGNGPTTRSPSPLIVRVQDGGFHWGDAAIGAAAGFGASLVAVGGIALRRTPARKAHGQSSEEGENP
jgi:hypothetical protein